MDAFLFYAAIYMLIAACVILVGMAFEDVDNG